MKSPWGKETRNRGKLTKDDLAEVFLEVVEDLRVTVVQLVQEKTCFVCQSPLGTQRLRRAFVHVVPSVPSCLHPLKEYLPWLGRLRRRAVRSSVHHHRYGQIALLEWKDIILSHTDPHTQHTVIWR